MSLKDAVAAATAPYRGFVYSATGNRYYDSTATAVIVDKYNDVFKLNLTPDELTEGVKKFGDWHRQQFGFVAGSRGAWDNWQSSYNQNYLGNFTPISDPVAIARESIANVLRARGLSESVIQEKYYTPLQSESAAGTKWAEDAAAGLNAAQLAAWKSVNPELDTSWGGLISDLASNPVVIAMAGTVLVASGAFTGLAGGTAAETGAALGADAAAGAFGAEALTGEVLANSGFVDVLGGFTDLTGTALTGWSEMAATTAITNTATVADSGFIDALGGMTDSTGTAWGTWADTATSTATTGASNVDTVSDWLSSYSSDPGPDPFATTADVNSGWSYNGGYEGVDWYNNAGIGEASSSTSLNDIFSNVSKALKSAGSILSGAQQLAAGQNRVQPNLTRSAGQMNLALPLLLGAAFFAFRG